MPSPLDSITPYLTPVISPLIFFLYPSLCWSQSTVKHCRKSADTVSDRPAGLVVTAPFSTVQQIRGSWPVQWPLLRRSQTYFESTVEFRTKERFFLVTETEIFLRLYCGWPIASLVQLKCLHLLVILFTTTRFLSKKYYKLTEQNFQRVQIFVLICSQYNLIRCKQQKNFQTFLAMHFLIYLRFLMISP